MATYREGRPTARGIKALLGLVVGLGVLIVAGVVLIVVTLIHRALAPRRDLALSMQAAPPAVVSALRQPPGTRIASLAAGSGGDWLAILLQGGGLPDRVVIVDPRQGGRPIGTIRLQSDAAQARP